MKYVVLYFSLLVFVNAASSQGNFSGNVTHEHPPHPSYPQWGPQVFTGNYNITVHPTYTEWTYHEQWSAFAGSHHIVLRNANGDQIAGATYASYNQFVSQVAVSAEIMSNTGGLMVKTQINLGSPPPPDPCGPLFFTREFVNTSTIRKTWSVKLYEEGMPPVELAQIVLEPGKKTTYTFDSGDEEVCGRITVEYWRDGPGYTDLIEQYAPDAPDPIDPIESQPLSPEETQPLLFEETDLHGIATDEDKPEIQKKIESDYILWQGSDARDQEIIDLLKEIETNTAIVPDPEGELVIEGFDDLAENVRTISALFNDGPDSGPSTEDMGQAGEDAGDAWMDIMEPYLRDGLGFGEPSSNPPIFEIDMPVVGVIDVNPFTPDRFGPLAAWVRILAFWAILYFFAMDVWGQIQQYVQAMSTMRQAQGNAVAAGTGAQATSLIAAGLITVAVVASMVLLLTFAFGDITIATFMSLFDNSPFQEIPAGVFWMLNQVVPVMFALTAILGKLTFRIWGTALFGVVSAIVRFVVP